MAPNVALRLRTLSTSALAGTTTLPNIRNSSTNVMTAMIPTASGRRLMSAWLVSTSWADEPPTSTGNGASASRRSWTSCSPSDEIGSTDGTTDSHVPSSDSKRSVSAPSTGTRCPSR